MTKILHINRLKNRAGKRRHRTLDSIKKELIDVYGIDLDKLMADKPVTSLSINEFDLLTESILVTIDEFCENYQDATVQDILYVLENVKEIVRETGEIDSDQ